jgi:hypothetical protein
LKNVKMIDKITPAQLADLAMHADLSDPIDWGMLELKEEDVFAMIAAQVLDMIQKNPEDSQLIVAMASLTKLTVENFVLNLRLHGKG